AVHRTQLEVQLLETPGDAHGLTRVAAVALELARDGGGGVGREFDLAVRVESVDRLDQADGGHLDQVVHRLPASGEPAGQVFDQPEVALDQPGTDLLVAGGPK